MQQQPHKSHCPEVGIVEVSTTNDPSMAMDLNEMSSADRRLAEQFGYKPVMKREFDFLSSFSFALSISSLFSSITMTFPYGLYAAGPASVVWTWLISGAGCLCLALSVAELLSAYPTCGGLYFTISRLAPKKQTPALSWITGWLNILGLTAGIASSQFGSAQLLLAAIAIGSDFTFVPTVNVTIGVMVGLVMVSALVNSLPTIWLSHLNKTYVMFHVVVLVSCSIALLAKTTDKHTAAYVFTSVDQQPLNGWSPVGFSFLLGSLSVSYTMTGYDCLGKIAEEVKNPEVKIPVAISTAMIFTYLAGFVFNVILCFCMGDPASILASPIAQPVSQLYYNALGKNGAIFFTVAALVVLQFGCINATQSLGRTIFAFSRDRLLPLSRVWVRIDPRTSTPLYAVWVGAAACIAINLVALGSLTAIIGVFNVCAIATDWSFVIPIMTKLVYGRFQRGPWHLGRYSKIINIWAVIWTIFSTVIFVLPTSKPVTSTTMNYASAYLVGILVLAGFYWILGGRKWYIGPIVQTGHYHQPHRESTSDEESVVQISERCEKDS